jgi:peptidoglycan/xylan/chitin deacetylase (PgdA/CDA1 family)
VTRTAKDTADTFQRKNLGQLTEANAWIRKVTGVQPVALCYPYGIYDLEAIGMAQRAAYKLGFTVDEGIADARPWDAFQIKRFTISNVETTESFRRRLLSGALPVRDIHPAPGSRVVGTNATVTVDITDVPADIREVRLSSGPALRKMKVVERDGRKYIEASFRQAKAGYRAMTMRGTGADGRAYYASWGIVLGDKAK